MTRDEAIAQMQLQMSFRTDQETNCINALKFAQTQLEAGPELPFWLISEDSFIDTVANEQRVPVPSDFIREADVAMLRYVPSDPEEDEVELTKHDYDILMRAYKGADPGPPEAYALMGMYIRIFPTPDDTYRIRQIYYKNDVVLSTNVENGWLKYNPMILMGKAGKVVAGGPLRDQTAVGVFSQWEQEGLLLLVSQTEARENAGDTPQMGGPT